MNKVLLATILSICFYSSHALADLKSFSIHSIRESHEPENQFLEMQFDSRVGMGTEWVGKESLLSGNHILAIQAISKKGSSDKQIAELKKYSQEFPVTQQQIEDLQAQKNYLLIKFDNIGKAKLEEITKPRISKRIGIVFNGLLLATPVVRDSIVDGILELQVKIDKLKIEELVKEIEKKN